MMKLKFINIASIILFVNVFTFLLSYSELANAQNQEYPDLKQYTEKLIDDGYKIFNNNNLSAAEKISKSGELIESNLQLDWMAEYSLGRHRRALSKEKINEFAEIYKKFVVKSYSNLTANYQGEKAVLKQIRKVDDVMFLVNTEIVKPDGQSPIKVDYLIHKISKNGKQIYKIADIITEGVSVINSQQSEFNSFIANNGFEALMNHLKEKTK